MVAASFIPNPGTDVALEIQQPLLSGKDVEFISGKPKEQEVLFPQGARFKVVSFQAQPPATAANTSTQNKLWVVLKEI